MRTSKSCVFAQAGDKLVSVNQWSKGTIIEFLDRHGNGTPRAMCKNETGDVFSVDLSNYELVIAREVPANLLKYYE